MPGTPYAGNPALFPANVRIVADGDNRNGVTQNTPLQDLADRTAYLYATLTGTSGGKITGNPVLSTYLTIDATVPAGIKFRTNVLPDADFTLANDFYDYYLLPSPAADRNLVITATPFGRDVFFGAFAPLTTADWSHAWNIYQTTTDPGNFICAIQLGSMNPLAGAYLNKIGSGWTVRQPVYNRWAPAFQSLSDADHVIAVTSPITTVVPSFNASPAADRNWTLPTAGVIPGSVVIVGCGRSNAAWTHRITLGNSICLNGFSAKLMNSPTNIDDVQNAILSFAGSLAGWQVISHSNT